jgi:cysteinyl-tRNA synthetase
MRVWLALVFAGCGSAAAPLGSDGGLGPVDGGGADQRAPDGSAPDGAVPDASAPLDGGGARGFPMTGPWLSFYGTSQQLGSLTMAASTFRILNIDADPDAGNFTSGEIAQLRASGQNRVISYLDVGSCENFRSYWTTAPGFVTCSANTAAQLGPYAGYPDEVWMNPANTDYQNLIVGYVAPRLAAQGVDGFFLDNLEIVEHGTATTDGPCDAACSQGGLDLVAKLRAAFPSMLIVMQNATSDVTRLGTTGGVALPSLLDGISHEEVDFPTADPTARMQLDAWRGMSLQPGGHPFFIGVEDYVGSCTNTSQAQTAYDITRDAGFSPYATDSSAGQHVVCYWPF